MQSNPASPTGDARPVFKVFKCRARLTLAPHRRLGEVLRLCCGFYNAALDERIGAWMKAGVSISDHDQCIRRGGRRDVDAPRELQVRHRPEGKRRADDRLLSVGFQFQEGAANDFLGLKIVLAKGKMARTRFDGADRNETDVDLRPFVRQLLGGQGDPSFGAANRIEEDISHVSPPPTVRDRLQTFRPGAEFRCCASIKMRLRDIQDETRERCGRRRREGVTRPQSKVAAVPLNSGRNIPMRSWHGMEEAVDPESWIRPLVAVQCEVVRIYSSDRKRSVAVTSSWMIPASVAAWPASGTMRRSASGQARCKSHAVRTGVHTS